MQTLSKGYQKPQTGDKSTGVSGWMPAVEANAQLSNDHEHNGVDGFPIKSSNLSGQTVSVLIAAFVDQGDGVFRATVSSPGAVNVSALQATMRDPTTKEVIYGKIAKASATSVYIYLNEPLDVEVLFGV